MGFILRYVVFALLVLGAPLATWVWPGLNHWWIVMPAFLAVVVLGVLRFPARWRLARRFDATDGELLAGARSALRAMRISWREDAAGVIHGEAPVNWRSWGERMSIQVADGSVSCESRCVLGVVDWGKNKANVMSFFRLLEGSLDAAPAARA